MLHLLLSTLLLFGSSFRDLPAPVSSQSSPNSALTVRLVPLKEVYKLAEPVQFRVEIENLGSTPIYVGNEIPTHDWLYHLDLIVTDTDGKISNKLHFFHPQMPDVIPQESDISALTKRWLLLRPGYFYGTIVQITPEFFEFLKKPGEYWIQGIYSCEGIDANFSYNQLARSPTFVEQLPYRSWKGRVRTNAAKVRIVSDEAN